MPNPFNTPQKKIVRDLWNSPLLKYLSDKYRFRYRYFGLPGVELLDVLAWRELIDEVVAFEMPMSKGKNPRANLVKLKRNLEELGIPYDVFYGTMEQVVLNRCDFEDKEYVQEKFINLYNLDFCNELTSKIDTIKGRECLRFELIRQLLIDQHQIYLHDKSQDKFILFITARNQTNSINIKSLLPGDKLNVKTAEYLHAANSENPIPTENVNLVGSHAWALKAFIFDTILSSYFSGPHISAFAFPLLKYDGMAIDDDIGSPMLHLMLLCKFETASHPRHQIYPTDYLRYKSVRATEREIVLCEEAGETAATAVTPLEILAPHEEAFFT